MVKTPTGRYAFDITWTPKASSLSDYQKSLLTDDFMIGANAAYIATYNSSARFPSFSTYVFNMVKDMKEPLTED